jgi:hypothetical protein
MVFRIVLLRHLLTGGEGFFSPLKTGFTREKIQDYKICNYISRLYAGKGLMGAALNFAQQIRRGEGPNPLVQKKAS